MDISGGLGGSVNGGGGSGGRFTMMFTKSEDKANYP